MPSKSRRDISYDRSESALPDLNASTLKSLAQKIQAILDWVPARIFALIFALGGHFTQVFACWKKGVLQGLHSSDELLADCGIAALDVVKEGRIPEDGEAEKESIALLDRVFVIVLVILAMIVILT